MRWAYIWALTWDFQQCGMCDQQSIRSACAYRQSDQSLCSSLEFSTSVKLLDEHHLEFLNLKWGCTGLSESTLSKCHIVGNHMSWLNYYLDLILILHTIWAIPGEKCPIIYAQQWVTLDVKSWVWTYIYSHTHIFGFIIAHALTRSYWVLVVFFHFMNYLISS